MAGISNGVNGDEKESMMALGKEDLNLQAVTITLNGREVSGYPGMTILELAKESGIEIPTLCHDAHLTPVGACRLCLVEEGRTSALMASCVTPIAPGMVISTHSPRVMEHRKNIIKLMLASHPDSCLVCDKGNRCQLRQHASDMGIQWIEFQRLPQMATLEEVNPFIEKDLSKCILCGKCIRACQELVVEGAIDYFRRGFVNKPATLNDSPLEASECTFCGTCVAMCPTGALMEKERPYHGTSRRTVQTTCPFCGCGCSISMEVKENRIVRVAPGEEDAISRGALCVRGSYGCDFVHSPDRLTTPLVRKDNSFLEVPWDHALEMVATEFKRMKDRDGPDSLAVLGSSKCTNEENYLLQKFTRCVLGTNNIDNGSRLYSAATRLSLGSSIGYSGTTNDLSDLEHSEAILVVGTNPTASAPIVSYAIKRAVKYQRAQLVSIDPRQTILSSFAHLWLRPKVGTDIALLNGMSKVIIDEGLLDEEFVARRTDNFEALTKSLERYTPEYVEATTGVPNHQIRAAARLYAKARGAAIFYGSGITRHTSGTKGVLAIANLALLTGNIGRKGGGIYALQRENNEQGACDMGVLPDFLPGYQSVTNDPLRKKFEERWGVSLPSAPGQTVAEMITQAKEGKIKGMYIVGENPILSLPAPNRVAEGLGALDCLVVQDMFLTETARLANVILPAASFAEKEGTFTNFEGRINRVRKAIERCGESLPDWEIILRLAEKMGSPLPFSSFQQIMDEIEELVPLYEMYTDPQRLHQVESETWKPRRTFGGQFLKGFARFSPVEYIPAEERTNGDYPFTLMTGTLLYHFGTGVRSSRSSRLKKFFPQAFVEMNESDALKLAIHHGDKIKLISPGAELTADVRMTDTLPEGTVFMPCSFPENPVHRLFDFVLDPQAKSPSLSACHVRIERIGPHG